MVVVMIPLGMAMTKARVGAAAASKDLHSGAGALYSPNSFTHGC